MEKVLFIVPHEDDELFVGGPLLVSLARSDGYEVIVFIATNGDSVPYESKYRIKESINALNRIGVPSDNILFGGYGDSWDGVHIYNMEEGIVKTSKAGRKETYFPLKKGAEWHYIKVGEHAPYTKKAYYEDIKLLINDICPDVIICVDLDSNSDHRCLSLLTDAALGEIIKEKPNYKPKYLKKYSYMGVLFGPDDYFIYPNAETKMTENSCINPYFLWSDRIRFSVPDDCNTILAKDNFLYKLSKIYKSQEIKFSVGRFVNDDVIYWKRNVNNLALHAYIEASSGEVSFLNDFVLIDSEDISVRDCDYSLKCWRPRVEDTNPLISIHLDKPQVVKEIVLYFNNVENADEKTLDVSLFDGEGNVIERIDASHLKKGMYYERMSTSSLLEVNRVNISVNGEDCSSVGLGEIEILGVDDEIPFRSLIYKDFPRENDSNYSIVNAKKQAEKSRLKLWHAMYKYFDVYCWKRRIFYFIRKLKGR